MPTQIVSSGLTSSGLSVTSGNTLEVVSGGTMSATTIESGGSALVDFGGTDSGSTILAGGFETLSGQATGDSIYGTQLISFGSAVATGETVYSGGAIDLFLKGGVVEDTTVMNGGTLAINGNATASNTILDSGALLDLQSPKAHLTGSVTLDGPATIQFDVAPDSGEGDLAVITGFGSGSIIDERAIGTGATFSTVISGGSTVATVTSGSTTETLIFAGSATSLGIVADGSGGVDVVYGSGASSIGSSTSGSITTISSGVTGSGAILSSGGTLLVQSGGTDIRAVIGSGGTALVNGVESGSVINTGGFENVSGQAAGDDVYGTQLVSATGASVTSETVHSGGTIDLALKGTSADAITVENGGTLALNGNISASDTVLDAGGLVDMQSPKATLTGSLTFQGPATLQFDDVSSAGFGDQAVISGFGSGSVIDERAIGSGAVLTSTTSGGETIATLTSGGVTETLTFAGTFTSGLTLSADGAGGVDIATTSATAPPPESSLAFLAGDLVLSVVGDSDGSGIYGDNQASPLSLEEVTTTGTVIGQMTLPQETTTVDGVTENAISAEYGSSSEGALELSADGQSLVIMGYGVNANTFNAGGAAVYGNAALGQSTSIQGGEFTPVPRVVADISYTGSVDTSTAVYNVFNTNNPRSVATVDGKTFYMSGQGVKGDTTQGVFTVQDGSSSATAIDTATDTRTVEIYDGSLYVSQDSKQPSDGGTSNISTFNGLPTGAATPVVLPGISQSITLQAGQANSVNSADIGETVRLSPENFYFANATTLYVADGGNPKQGGLGDGGLQKWSYSGSTWSLDYTLSTGLDLVPDTASSGTTGLIGLTGEVEGDTVDLFATNATIGDLDQTYLFGISDSLDATTLPTDESFQVLETAAADTNIRGVAFAPTAPCFAAGTMIRTETGAVPVEALSVGDRIVTLDDEILPIRWIGHRHVACARHPQPESVQPVRVAAGAFGPGLPARALFLSPDHAVFAEGVLIPVKHLVNGGSVAQIAVDHVTYFHIELDEHAVIFAEGLPAESYLDTGDRRDFANGAEAMTLHPVWGSEARDVTLVHDAFGVAPLRVTGPEVDRVRAMLAARRERVAAA